MKILLAIPTFTGDIHAMLVCRISEWSKKYDIFFFPVLGMQPVDHARNHIVEEFLKTDFDYLMMIDNDTIPPEDAIEKLLKHDKEFVSGLTPIVSGADAKILKYNAVGADDKEIKPNTGLQVSRGVGASCLLIKREVFKKIPKPYFRFKFEADNGNPCYVTEDIFFISRLINAGIIPYVDSDVVCVHAKKALW